MVVKKTRISDGVVIEVDFDRLPDNLQKGFKDVSEQDIKVPSVIKNKKK